MFFWKSSMTILLIFNALYVFGQIIYVVPNGHSDGSSWSNSSSLSTALSQANYGDEIWLQEGIYTPTTCSSCTFSDRNIFFEVPNGVQLFGGFRGFETQKQERDWFNRHSILSGDIDHDLDSTNNAFTILYFHNVDENTLIDGLVFEHGNANHNSLIDRQRKGGAIFNNGGNSGTSNPTIKNCTFRHNFAQSSGGAIFNEGKFNGSANPLIINCLFDLNIADLGGAIFNNGHGGQSSPKIHQCRFYENDAEATGGAIYSFSRDDSGISEPEIVNSIFHENTANSAGAIYGLSVDSSYTHSHIINCVIYDNYANVGGAIYVNASDGGATEATISNCIIGKNHAGFDDNFHYSGNASPIIHISHSLIDEGNCSDLMEGNGEIDCGDGMIYDEFPHFVDTDLLNFRLKDQSPARDAGSNLAVTARNIDVDFDNLSRLAGQVDLGAHEYNPADSIPLIIRENPLQQLLCTNDSVILSVAANGAIPLQYQWQKDGEDINGENDNQLIINNLDFDDEANYTCIVTDGYEVETLSDTAFLEISEIIDATIDILPSTLEICAGDTISFTTSTSGEGEQASYQWFLNDLPVGNDTSTFILENASDQDAITCQLTSSFSCVNESLVLSEINTITVQELQEVSISITADTNSICPNEQVNFIAEGNHAGNTPIYEWFINSEIQDIGAMFSSNSLTDNDLVHCQLTSSEQCVLEETAESAPITLSVLETIIPQIIIETETTSICDGGALTFVSESQNEGEHPNYEWYVNGEAMSINDTTFTLFDISNNDEIYATILSSENCALDYPISSDSILIETTPLSAVAVQIEATNTTICTGDSITFTATGIGEGASPEYIWFINEQAIAEGATFTPNSLINNDLVYCQMTSSLACVSNNTAVSDSILVTINPIPNPSIFITSADTIACEGEEIIFYAVTNDAGINPQLEWAVNGEMTGIQSNTFTTNNLSPANNIVCHLIAHPACATDTLFFSNELQLEIIPLIETSILIEADKTTFCANELETIHFTATTENAGTDAVYSWEVNENSIGGNESDLLLEGFSNGDSVTCTVLTNHECTLSNELTSAAISLTVFPIPEVQLAAFDTLCHDDEPLFLTQGSPANGNYDNAFIIDNYFYPASAVGTTQSIEYTYTDENGCSDSATGELVVELCTATTETTQITDFQVLPNPTTTYLTIKGTAQRLEIYDMQGHLLLQQKHHSETSIDVSDWTTGTYLVRLIDAKKVGMSYVIIY